jgi:hypothetical protein
MTGKGNINTQGQEGGTNTIVNQTVELVFQSAELKQEVWTEVEMKDVPPGVADYVLVLFRSNIGRISGKVRIKGSQDVSPFYTTVNNTVRSPCAICGCLPKVNIKFRRSWSSLLLKSRLQTHR